MQAKAKPLKLQKYILRDLYASSLGKKTFLKVRTDLTEVRKHLLDSPSCKIGFENCQVLGYKSLLTEESLDGKLLYDKLMSVPLFIFNLLCLSDQSKGRTYPRFELLQ